MVGPIQEVSGEAQMIQEIQVIKEQREKDGGGGLKLTCWVRPLSRCSGLIIP